MKDMARDKTERKMVVVVVVSVRMAGKSRWQGGGRGGRRTSHTDANPDKHNRKCFFTHAVSIAVALELSYC
ncbi:hypothetical protein E2C01_000977 [Portunus trituberculatus]|uniref:Uncharacterized protein n=1 Tax=Portunus trituberculatus TaxID=210409 RepID=A0A5B7CI36_PORTR|nr:hypothetical protein [Portunus trituberculatus]